MNTAQISRITSNHPVDRLGALRAQIADLEAQAKPLADELKAAGPGVTEGQLFKATVSEVVGREVIDPAAMEEKLRDLGVTENWFRHHRKTTASSLRLAIKDR